jgi:phosphoribosylformylglycinamidine synthase
MNAAVIVFPGTNREKDIAAALAQAGGGRPSIVWHKETALPKADLIVLPGGFSYGDYLRCGAMAAKSPIMRAVVEAAHKGVPVLGICNGFQILVESGLLPGALMRNAKLRFICKFVHLRVEQTDSLFTAGYRPGQVIRVPVAHGEGNYYADDATLDRLEGEGRIAFRYVLSDGRFGPGANANGSARNIAGIFNETRTVLGMMPHPEDAVEALHGSQDGAALFRSVAAGLKAVA